MRDRLIQFIDEHNSEAIGIVAVLVIVLTIIAVTQHQTP